MRRMRLDGTILPPEISVSRVAEKFMAPRLRIVKGFLDMYVQLNRGEEIGTWICDFRVRAKV